MHALELVTAHTCQELADIWSDESTEEMCRRHTLAELIRRSALDDSTGRQVSNLLAELLYTTVRDAARQVIWGLTRTHREDFIDESPSLIIAPREKSPPRIRRYDPELGPLVPWLKSVLCKCWLSKLRKESAKRRLGSKQLDFSFEPAAPGLGALDQLAAQELLSSPLSSTDLARIENWNPLLRVELICLGLLFPIVPAKHWERWLQYYESKRKLTLPRPFPPETVLDIYDRRRRMQAWVPLLHYSRENLSTRYCRYQYHLYKLDRLNELRGRER